MAFWEIEAIDLLNQRGLHICDPGPLHAPIKHFSVRRNESLAILLETELGPAAKSNAVSYPSGTVRLGTDEVKMAGPEGTQAILIGVQSTRVTGKLRLAEIDVVSEIAQVHRVCVKLSSPESAAYIIEWLEDIPCSPFIWPDTIRTTIESNVVHVFGGADESLTISTSSSGGGTSRSAVKLNIVGQTLYLCARSNGRSEDIKRGCIIYVGTPDDTVRKKIRVALSFALGFYIVEMGHTVFDAGWHVLSATSLSAYSLSKRTFDPVPMPLASLSDRNFQHDLDRTRLERMVGGLVEHYELLDLGNLSWAYWHAGTATVHIAPAHFGAAVEALQTAYCKSHPSAGKTKILPTPAWRKLREALTLTIELAEIEQDCIDLIKEKLSDVNRPPQRIILNSVAEALGLVLSDSEKEAWKRRNDAAHGTSIPEGDELLAVRDKQLLRGLFSRMLLRMSNAADNCVDYATPDYPVRPLRESVNLEQRR